METRGVLPSLRTVAAPADCIRPRTGNGRNRYVPAASACRGSVVNRYARAPAGAAGRDGLTWHGYYPAVLFFGLFSQFHDYNRNVISLRRHSANGKVRLLHSCELIRPKLLRPFVEFHKAIFWVGGWDPYLKESKHRRRRSTPDQERVRNPLPAVTKQGTCLLARRYSEPDLERRSLCTGPHYRRQHHPVTEKDRYLR